MTSRKPCEAFPLCQSPKWHVIVSCLGSKEMWEPRSHDTLVLPQISWQQPPSPKPYVPVVSSNDVFVSYAPSDTRATPQPGPILESIEDPLPRKRRKPSPVADPTGKPPPQKRRKISHQQHSLREHKIAVMSDQSFMLLYPSRANFGHEIQDQRGTKPSPTIVNATDMYISSRVRDLELHAEWWLKDRDEVGDNGVVFLAMNLFGDRQYDFDVDGCKFSVVARPANVQAVAMKESMDVIENRV